jgi:hypothetical protein
MCIKYSYWTSDSAIDTLVKKAIISHTKMARYTMVPYYSLPLITIWESNKVTSVYDVGRRDDLESIGYVALYVLRGNLPWKSYKSKSSEDNLEKVM